MKTILLSILTMFIVAIKTYCQNSSQCWSLSGNNNVTRNSKLGTTNNYSIRFYTNDTQRMVINSPAGLVGIGTTTPNAGLHVNSVLGTNPFRVQVYGNTKLLVHKYGGVSIGGNLTPPFDGLYVSGNTGIGTNEPLYKLDVNGQARVSDYLIVDSGITGQAAQGPHAGVMGLGSAKENTEDYGVYGFTVSGTAGGFTSLNGTGVYASSGYGSYAVEADGDIYCHGTYLGSDKNIKKNISNFENAMDIINKLKPRKYEFRNEGKFAFLRLPKGSHFGLIAQDLEEVLPNLVKETSHIIRPVKPVIPTNLKREESFATPVRLNAEKKEVIDIKAVNYTELIPIVIKGMQELNEAKDKQINDLQRQIDELKALVRTITKEGANVNSASSALIKQSAPNPSDGNTIISYFIPTNSTKAEIIITDMKGIKLKTYNVSSGRGQLNIKKGELPAGIYNYTLYINNNRIDTKQMVIV